MTAETVSDIRQRLAKAGTSQLPRLIAAYENDPRGGVASAVAAARARVTRARRERTRVAALYRLEDALRREGHTLIAGVDEVGRGALAGPVTAAAVVLPASPRLMGLDDSKRLNPERREELAERLRAEALTLGVAHVPAADIDAIGIAAAVKRAMALALEQLAVSPDRVLVDGLPVGLTKIETAVVKGDSKVAAIAAASIIAKVSRDGLMASLAPEYPQYSFEINKGYGTDAHVSAMHAYGLTPHHRRSFTSCGGTMPLF